MKSIRVRKLSTGKVRTVYEIGDDRIVLVAGDGVSAFDQKLGVQIPDKGAILTQLSAKWFERTARDVPNAFITADSSKISHSFFHQERFEGRATEMEKLYMIPLEIIVRGYITGSAWKDYCAGAREICGIPLPEGLENSEKLPYPIVTPTTKAPAGQHDANLSYPQAIRHLIDAGFGNEKAQDIVDELYMYALRIYDIGTEYAEKRGLIIADTKLEFGLDARGRIKLADEVLTPDSSRFWPKDEYGPGREQDSFDKQIIRNYIREQEAGGETVTSIPNEIIDKTARRYQECYDKLTA